MSELIEQLRHNFQDDEYRSAYAESFMNSYVAAQIKTLREENELTQEQLAEKIGTKQAGISRLENVNYSSWKVETLRKLARAFKVRLKITFEEFGTLPEEIEGFRREALVRLPFDKDPLFYALSANEKVTTKTLSGDNREHSRGPKPEQILRGRGRLEGRKLRGGRKRNLRIYRP